METNELKIIWQTLANEKLIEKELAKQNIERIINQKGIGLIAKMKKQIMVDYIIYLTAFLLLPCLMFLLNFVLNKPSPVLQIIGVLACECYLLIMFLKSRSKLKYLHASDNTGTIKESMVKFKTNYLKIIRKEKVVAYLFGYFIMTFALMQYFITKGSFLPLDFSQPFAYLPIFLIFMMVILPVFLKLEYKMRYAKALNEISQTLNELNVDEL